MPYTPPHYNSNCTPNSNPDPYHNRITSPIYLTLNLTLTLPLPLPLTLRLTSTLSDSYDHIGPAKWHLTRSRSNIGNCNLVLCISDWVGPRPLHESDDGQSFIMEPLPKTRLPMSPSHSPNDAPPLHPPSLGPHDALHTHDESVSQAFTRTRRGAQALCHRPTTECAH